jgi:hypothetical protein
MAKYPTPLQDTGGKFEPIQISNDGGLGAYQEKTNKRFADIEQLTKAIIFLAIITLIGVVVAVSGLVIDQMHFNNQTYTQGASDNKTEIQLLQDEVNQLKASNEQKTIPKSN